MIIIYIQTLLYNIGKIIGMKTIIARIGDYSYYPKYVIGQGANAMVYLGFRNSDKYPLAVKIIKLEQINTPVKQHLLNCEINALKSIKSKYVCEIVHIFKETHVCYVVMEYCSNGSLRNYIKSKGKLSEKQSLRLFSQILEGYCSIRQNGFIHRDLKTQNILLRANMQPVIIDFGYCQKIQTQGRHLQYNVGSPAYMSPEAYNLSIYSQKSDVWALGVILHQMVTGTIPVMRTQNTDEYFSMLKGWRTAQIVKAPQSQQCSKIILSTLTVDLKFRPTAEQLKYLVFNINNPQVSHLQTQKFKQKPAENIQLRLLNRIKSNDELNLTHHRIVVTPQKTRVNIPNGHHFNVNRNQSHNLNHFVEIRNKQKEGQGNGNNFLEYRVKSPDNGQQLRRTLPAYISPQPPNFFQLRKRIQTTADSNPYIDVTKVRKIEKEEIMVPQQSPHRRVFKKEGTRTIYLHNSNNDLNQSLMGKIKKSTSSKNLMFPVQF